MQDRWEEVGMWLAVKEYIYWYQKGRTIKDGHILAPARETENK